MNRANFIIELTYTCQMCINVLFKCIQERDKKRRSKKSQPNYVKVREFSQNHIKYLPSCNKITHTYTHNVYTHHTTRVCIMYARCPRCKANLIKATKWYATKEEKKTKNNNHNNMDKTLTNLFNENCVRWHFTSSVAIYK